MSKYGVFSGPYFLVFGLNTEIYSVNLRIQSGYRKIGPENTPIWTLFTQWVDYHIRNRLEALKISLLTYPFMAEVIIIWKSVHWFVEQMMIGTSVMIELKTEECKLIWSVFFHNYLKCDDFCNYEWKFKIQKVEWNVYSAKKRTNFYRKQMCVPISITVQPLQLCAHYGRPLTLYMMCFFLYPRNLDIMKYYTKLTAFLILFLLSPQNKNSQLMHCIFT